MGNISYGSARLIDVIENISDLLLDGQMINEIVTCYADRGYDAAYTSGIISGATELWLLYSIQEQFQTNRAKKSANQLQQDKICSGTVLWLAKERLPQDRDQVLRRFVTIIWDLFAWHVL